MHHEASEQKEPKLVTMKTSKKTDSTIKPLTRINLHAWQPTMESQLITEQLDWVFAQDPPQQAPSAKDKARAKQLLLVTVSQAVLDSAETSELLHGKKVGDFDSRDRWKFYIKYCANAGGHRRLLISQKIEALKLWMLHDPDPSKMNKFLDNMNDLFLQFVRAGGTMTSQTLTSHVINALRDKYDSVTGQYHDEAKPDFEKMANSLRSVATNRQSMAANYKNRDLGFHSDVGMYTQSRATPTPPGKPTISCYNCQGPHPKRLCPQLASSQQRDGRRRRGGGQPKQGQRQKQPCAYCLTKTGKSFFHRVEDCRRRAQQDQAYSARMTRQRSDYDYFSPTRHDPASYYYTSQEQDHRYTDMEEEDPEYHFSFSGRDLDTRDDADDERLDELPCSPSLGQEPLFCDEAADFSEMENRPSAILPQPRTASVVRDLPRSIIWRSGFNGHESARCNPVFTDLSKRMDADDNTEDLTGEDSDLPALVTDSSGGDDSDSEVDLPMVVPCTNNSSLVLGDSDSRMELVEIMLSREVCLTSESRSPRERRLRVNSKGCALKQHTNIQDPARIPHTKLAVGSSAGDGPSVPRLHRISSVVGSSTSSDLQLRLVLRRIFDFVSPSASSDLQLRQVLRRALGLVWSSTSSGPRLHRRLGITVEECYPARTATISPYEFPTAIMTSSTTSTSSVSRPRQRGDYSGHFHKPGNNYCGHFHKPGNNYFGHFHKPGNNYFGHFHEPGNDFGKSCDSSLKSTAITTVDDDSGSESDSPLPPLVSESEGESDIEPDTDGITLDGGVPSNGAPPGKSNSGCVSGDESDSSMSPLCEDTDSDSDGDADGVSGDESDSSMPSLCEDTDSDSDGDADDSGDEVDFDDDCSAYNLVSDHDAHPVSGDARGVRVFNSHVSFVAKPTVLHTDNTEFCLDSGTTSHICGDRDLLMNYRPSDGSRYLGEVKSTVRIDGVGDLPIRFRCVGGAKVPVRLSNVLHVRGAVNLVSVGRLTDAGASVSFTPSVATVRFSTFTVLAHRVPRGRIYMLDVCFGGGDLRNQHIQKCMMGRESFVSVQHMHESLNHRNLRDMQKRARAGEYDHLPPKFIRELLSTTRLQCTHCAVGKSTRHRLSGPSTRMTPVVTPVRATLPAEETSAFLSTNAATTTSTATPAELHPQRSKIHSDTWGPTTPSRHGGYRYAVIFIHKETDMWFIEGLVSKASGPVLAILEDIISLCKKFGHEVHIFMSDRGTEYTAAATSAYIAVEGMLRQYSVPHRQDQNHYPERAWRTIQGKVSSMLSRSGNGTSYWLLAMRSVVYLHNREGSPGRSPYERFFRMAPVMPPRHPFGSLALAVKPKGLQRKLHPRVRRCIHVGYDTHGKGAYLLEDMHTGRLLVRLDVSSYDIFPFRTHAQMGLVRDLVETVELTSPANDPLPRQPDVEEENHGPEVQEEAKRQEPVENGPDLAPDNMVHEQPVPVVGDEVRGRQRGGLRRSSRVRTAAHGSTGTTDEYQANSCSTSSVVTSQVALTTTSHRRSPNNNATSSPDSHIYPRGLILVGSTHCLIGMTWRSTCLSKLILIRSTYCLVMPTWRRRWRTT